MALPQGAYNHKDHEMEILKKWLETGAYKPKSVQTQNAGPLHQETTNKIPENWTLICPPPNAYGRPHVGNISGYAYIDAMARIQRMKEKNVLVIPGKDHAGLEGEGVFVREVLEKQGRKKFDMKREDFYAEMMEFFKSNMKQAREDEQNIGLSADFDLDTFTLDPDIVDIVLDTFIEMYQKGMIYKGVRIVNWDPKARTAIADNQVIYEDAITPFYYFKYSFGEPDPQALKLKQQFEGQEVEWFFERNATSDGKSDLPFTFGMLNNERHNFESIQQDNIEIIGVGYDPEINFGQKLKGKAVGIFMRINAPHQLVVINNQSDDILKKDYIVSFQKEFQKIFEFESKHYAGAHLILFDQYPDDKFYTNGFIIGTVRPETIFADTAIACNPDDDRYKDFIGKKVEVEFLGRKKKLSFISDYSVLPDFGTGLLKITPAHANEDWEIAQRHPHECLPAIQVIGYDLKMNSLAGKYQGMKIKEARETMENEMIEYGNLIYVDREYKNKVAIAERTKAPIEPLLSSQWYLSYDVPVGERGKTLRQAALEMVNGKEIRVGKQNPSSLKQHHKTCLPEIKILPASMVGKFNNWMNNLRDWAISRSLWWGYRLPVWYHGEVKEEIGADGQVRELIRLSNSNSNNIQIVIAQIEDAETIHKISVDGWHDNFVNEAVGFTIEKMQNDFGKKYDNQDAINNIKNGIQDESKKYFVAKVDGRVVGWVSVDNINKDETHWLDIYVDRNYRGKGVGKQLINYAIKNTTEVKRFDIAVPENSPAVDFYKKLGFVEYDRNDKNEYGFPVIQMKLYSENFNNLEHVILVDAVRTIISANENYDLESFTLNKELADYLAELGLRIVAVTDATNDGYLEKIKELLKDYNFEVFTLHKKPLKDQSEYFTKLAEELSINLNNAIYFDHKQENLYSAMKAGVKQTKLYTQNNKNIIEWIKSLLIINDTSNDWVPLEYNNPNHILVQKQSPGEGWFQDENVLDTWFSSAQWPYATLMKYGLIKERYPTDVMLSGFDILENWDSRMIMFSYFKTGKVPFKTLYLTGLVRGTDGQKMSKSRGNIIDIDQVREKYGTDAVRMVYYYQNTAGADYAMTYEKLETFKRFANKIWNASKFVLMHINEDIDTKVNNLKVEDIKLKENIELFNFITQAKVHVTKNIDEYEFGLATYNLYQYFWHDFADIHIESVKKYVLPKRDKTTKEVIQEPNTEYKTETARVLLFTLKSFIKMLHPFMPFITQRIWNEVPKEEGEHEFIMYNKW